MCLKRFLTNIRPGQIAILLLFSATPFLPSLSFPLLDGWDDHIYVTGNVDKLSFNPQNIVHWFSTPCEGCFLPLTMISYMLDFSIWGLDATGYHLQNLFWHLVAALALHRLLLTAGVNPRLALLSSILFAVHPQRAESVVWISERKDVLCAAFYLWAIVLFLRSESDESPSHRTEYAVSVVLAIFAVLSKPMAVSLPFIILFLSLRQAGRLRKKTLLKTLPFFAVAAIFIPVAIISQDIPQAHLSVARRFAVAAFNVPWYAIKTFLPFNLSPIYPRITPSADKLIFTAAFYALAVAGIVFILLRKKRAGMPPPQNLLLILAFLVSLAPVSGIVPLGAIDYADRYSYIPSAFLIMFTALLLNRFFAEKRAAKQLSIAFAVYIAILAMLTYFHSYAWSSYRALLESAVSHNPPAYMALGALADLEFFTGDRSRIPQIAKIVREREAGWESQGGIRRIIFKTDVLEMRYHHEAGNSSESAKIAKRLLKNDLSELIGDQNDRNRFIRLLEEIKSGHEKVNIHLNP